MMSFSIIWLHVRFYPADIPDPAPGNRASGRNFSSCGFEVGVPIWIWGYPSTITRPEYAKYVVLIDFFSPGTCYQLMGVCMKIGWRMQLSEIPEGKLRNDSVQRHLSDSHPRLEFTAPLKIHSNYHVPSACGSVSFLLKKPLGWVLIFCARAGCYLGLKYRVGTQQFLLYLFMKTLLPLST